MTFEEIRTGAVAADTRESTSPVKIAIIGVGGCGSNAVDNMITAGVKVNTFMAINTDRQALRVSKAHKRIQIGSNLTNGFGAGADAEKGKKAAEESKETLNNLIKDMDLVFITAGMGGGTGTGAAPVIAELAHNLGKLVIAFVTTPFMFEGEVRMRNAQIGINNLRKFVDSIIIIPNERLANVAKDMTMQKAFEYADDVLRQGVQATSDLIANPGRVNIDFADICTILRQGGDTIMGIGRANGTNRAMIAMQKAVNNAVLGTSIEGASRVIINVEGKEVKMDEVSKAVDVIRGVCAKGANIIFGTAIVPELQDSIQVTIIATGFNKSPIGIESRREELAQTSSMIEEAPAPQPQPIFKPQPQPAPQSMFSQQPQPTPQPEPRQIRKDNGRVVLDDTDTLSWWQKLKNTTK